MSLPLTVGIDIGTGGARALAAAPDGTVVAQATAEYPLYVPRPGWTEQRPEDWWTGAVAALRAMKSALGSLPAHIVAVGLTGQMHGSVFLDGHGAVVRPALLWNDQRTSRECAEITERVGAERLLRLVGNPALTGFTAPKLLWLRRHEPERYASVNHLLLPKDYVRFRLTGALATDADDASGTLLFDVVRRRWSAEMLAALDLPASLLPEVHEGPEVTGYVTAEAAAATGLPAGTPVVAGGGDQAAGAVGVGVVRTGLLSCSIGTSGVAFAASETPRLEPQGKLHAFCHAVPGTWHLMGVMLSAGGSLRWLRDALFADEVAAARAAAADPYDWICERAAAIPRGSEGLLFLPYLTGERTPHADPYARGAFIGLGLHHGRDHMARAVLEGISLGLKDSLDLVAALGIEAPEVRLTGGGARSPFWRQLLADAFSLPCRTMAVDEGPAFGAAILATVAGGLYPDVPAAAAAMVRTGLLTEPDPAAAPLYARLHEDFRAAYAGLRPLFPRLADYGRL